MLLYAMAQSLSHLIVHAVFSAKDRRALLRSEEIRSETYSYLAGIEHHRKFSYQEELRELLKRHRVSFDERYLWEYDRPSAALSGRFLSGPSSQG
jgi:hypothetical protein